MNRYAVISSNTHPDYAPFLPLTTLFWRSVGYKTICLLTSDFAGQGGDGDAAGGIDRQGVGLFVVEHLNVDAEKVTDNASFIEDLGADSLDNVELVMAFEEEFDIEIPDDAAEHIQTVGDAVKFISEKTGG